MKKHILPVYQTILYMGEKNSERVQLQLSCGIIFKHDEMPDCVCVKLGLHEVNQISIIVLDCSDMV